MYRNTPRDEGYYHSYDRACFQGKPFCLQGYASVHVDYSRDIFMELSWQTGILTLGDTKDSCRYLDLVSTLNNKLRELTSQPCGTQIVCQHMADDSALLLRPFWPNHCACFGDLQGYNGIWHDPSKHGARDKCCLCRGIAKPEFAGRLLQPEIEHKTQCPKCTSEYTWTLIGKEVRLRRSVQITIEKDAKPKNFNWLLALYPGLYGHEPGANRAANRVANLPCGVLQRR